jgi:hypothetical protein
MKAILLEASAAMQQNSILEKGFDKRQCVNVRKLFSLSSGK